MPTTLDSEFSKLQYRFNHGKGFFIDESLEEAVIEFLDEHKHEDWEVFDDFFNRFNEFWIQPAKDGHNIELKAYHRVIHVFDTLLNIVHKWEENDNSKIHKGSPYYYYGMASILNGDLEKGFSLMHQAAMEDKRYNRSDTPAYYFILLNPTEQEQLFYTKVSHISSFLEELLCEYRNRHCSSLNILTLRKKLLQVVDYVDESFLFVYCIFKFNWYIERIDDNFRKNPFASYSEASLMFELCKVCESVLNIIYRGKNNPDEKKYLPELFHRLCFEQGIGLKQNDFEEGINKDRKRKCGFHTTLNLLLCDSYSFMNLPSPPTKIEYDLGITYLMRNFGGHSIQEMDIIYENFKEVFQRILNVFFYIVEMKL